MYMHIYHKDFLYHTVFSRIEAAASICFFVFFRAVSV